jgi:hypothetical protein
MRDRYRDFAARRIKHTSGAGSWFPDDGATPSMKNTLQYIARAALRIRAT